MYQDYIDGKREIRDINIGYNRKGLQKFKNMHLRPVTVRWQVL